VKSGRGLLSGAALFRKGGQVRIAELSKEIEHLAHAIAGGCPKHRRPWRTGSRLPSPTISSKSFSSAIPSGRGRPWPISSGSA
jgi:hypothetical protein